MRGIDKDILALVKKSPSGATDPRVLDKLAGEFQELREAAEKGNDPCGALLEAADCLYYTVKAQYNGHSAPWVMVGVYRLTRFTPEQVREACLIKYRRRFLTPGYPKDDRAERLAVQHLLGD